MGFGLVSEVVFFEMLSYVVCIGCFGLEGCCLASFGQWVQLQWSSHAFNSNSLSVLALSVSLGWETHKIPHIKSILLTWWNTHQLGNKSVFFFYRSIVHPYTNQTSNQPWRPGAALPVALSALSLGLCPRLCSKRRELPRQLRRNTPRQGRLGLVKKKMV